MGARYPDHDSPGNVRVAAAAEQDLKALQDAFELYTRTAQSMEESYRRLDERVRSLDRELQQRNRELEFTTGYLNSILNSMTDGVIAIDNDGVITTFNRAASTILGHSPEDVLGHPFKRIFARDFSAGSGRPLMELKSRNAGAIPTAERDSTINDHAGNRTGLVKVFQDLTEIEALREQVRRMDRLAALGEMAATVAHEIRNPLGGIRGFATLLQRDIDDADPRARLLEKILVGVKSLETVVNELLEYTRPVHLDLKPESCARIVENALASLDPRNSSIEIENRVARDLPVAVDVQKIRQVLLNILLNAQQSITGPGAITITANQHGPDVVIAIADTGCGISASDLDRVFSPFYTTKEKGAGLGLAVASKIVESHGGSIKVQSTPGNGSTFLIHLPSAEKQYR